MSGHLNSANVVFTSTDLRTLSDPEKIVTFLLSGQDPSGNSVVCYKQKVAELHIRYSLKPFLAGNSPNLGVGDFSLCLLPTILA